MKRTKRLVGSASTLQGKIPPDDLHNVIGGGDLLDGFLWDSGHSGLQNPTPF